MTFFKKKVFKESIKKQYQINEVPVMYRPDHLYKDQGNTKLKNVKK